MAVGLNAMPTVHEAPSPSDVVVPLTTHGVPVPGATNVKLFGLLSANVRFGVDAEPIALLIVKTVGALSSDAWAWLPSIEPVVGVMEIDGGFTPEPVRLLVSDRPLADVSDSVAA